MKEKIYEGAKDGRSVGGSAALWYIMSEKLHAERIYFRSSTYEDRSEDIWFLDGVVIHYNCSNKGDENGRKIVSRITLFGKSKKAINRVKRSLLENKVFNYT